MKFLKSQKNVGILVFIIFIMILILFANNFLGQNRKPMFGFLAKKPAQ